MEIRHGPSSIAIEGDTDEGLKHVKRARKLIYSLRERVKLGGIESLSGQLRIPGSSAHIYASVSPAGDKALIVVDEQGDGSEEGLLSQLAGFPDALSGVVRTGLMSAAAAGNFTVPFRPTQFCAQQFGLPMPQFSSARLAVPPDQAMRDVFGEPPRYSGPPYSQHVHCKPSWYSGLMAKVVQFLLGVGYASDPGVYGESEAEGVDPDAERKAEIARSGLRVRYDFRFMRCHGVALGSDGRPWLVEISASRGVILMPLPLFEQTTLQEFRELVEDMGDDLARSVLDDFGGFPTGESIPAGGPSLEQAIGTGIVVRALSHSELSGFYEHTAYGSAMGWSFRPDGRRAFNTAWRFGLDHIQRGVMYQIRIEPGVISDQVIKQTPDRIELASLFTPLISGPADRWRVKKVYRLDDQQLGEMLSAARSGGIARQAAWDELGSLSFPPIAAVSAGITKMSEGPLWWPTKFGPKILFPDVLLRMNVQHSMRPGLIGLQFNGRCDTPMHVCHTNGTRDVVRFFYDTAVAGASVDDGFEDCMLVGTFSRVSYSGGGTVGATFYSTKIDNREERSPSEQTFVIEGRYIGVSQVSVADDLTFPPRGLLARTHRYLIKSSQNTVRGARSLAAISVPYYCRDAYYHAGARVIESENSITVWSYQHLADPWTYETWRNFPGWTGFTSGGLFIRGEHPDGCGQVDARTVRALQFYNPYQCSEYADFGSWAETCDNADAMVYGLPVPQVPATVATNKPSSATLTVTLVPPNGDPFVVEQRNTDGTAWISPWFQDDPYTVWAVASSFSSLVVFQPAAGKSLRFNVNQGFDPDQTVNFVGNV